MIRIILSISLIIVIIVLVWRYFLFSDKSEKKVRFEETRITEGDLVEITGGVFRGLTGYIKELRGNYKLIVNINELNSTFSVQLNNSDIKLLKPIKNTYH